LGYPVADDEVKSHTAGKSTMEQVRAVQRKLNIKFDEQYVVDQATYEAMRDLITKEGHTDKLKTFVLSGTVFNLNGERVKHQKLMAVDVDLKGAAVYKTVRTEEELLKEGFEFLLSGKSDANGNYYIEFFEMQYKNPVRKKADVVVYAIDNENQIIGRSRMVNSEDYSALGEVEDLDVLITAKDERSEYEILMGKLRPFLEENKVKLFELNKSPEQIHFLSGELDIAETQILLAADAEKLFEQCSGKTLNEKGRDTDIGISISNKYQGKNKLVAHELLYGIGRQQIVLDWMVLYKKTDAELLNVIQLSIKQNIIQQYDEKKVITILEILHQCAANHFMTYQDSDESPSLQKLLSFALPERTQQLTFTDAYRKFKNNVPDDETVDYRKFWKEYLPSQEAFKNKPELISSLLLSQQLLVLSGSYLPLVEELQINQKIATISELVKFEEKDWKKIIKKVGVPDIAEGSNDEEKISNYANQMQTIINAAYPTKKIVAMLDKQQLPIKNAAVAKGLNNFLNRNEKYDIGRTPVHEFADELKTITGENFNEAKKELNRIQRVFQVSPSPKAMVALMEKNLNSAYSITSYSKDNFIKIYSDSLGSDAIAEAVYQRAEHISTLAAERAMKMYDLSHLAAPAYAYSESDRKEVTDLLQAQVSKRHNPNYSEIFGSPDICECENCKSVYGAAAYFIDLLRFLEKGIPNTDGKSPLDMFEKRRPDLLFLPLTCENTNTLIPYIDLVNEVMEYYTAKGTMPVDTASNAPYDTGEATADELRANPQNFVPDAYKTLKDAVYPFSLPYHQPLDIIRTYSNHLKTERYDVMLGLQRDFSAKATKAIEAEALHISQEEFKVLTGKEFDITIADTRQLQEYYGFPASASVNPELDPVVITNLEKLAGIGVSDGIHEFLRRTGVKYTDLVEIVKTQFINPYQKTTDFLQKLFLNSSMNASTIYNKLKQINAGTLNAAADPDIISILNSASIAPADFNDWTKNNFTNFNAVITLYQSDSLCDLNTTYLKTIQNIYSGKPDSGVSNEIWSKFHRFIRLWRKLGWSVHETDLMLTALGESNITDTTISKLSYVVNLNKTLKLPIDKLATFWGNIDTYGEKSLYRRLFLNKTILRLDDAFHADKFGNYFTDSTQVLRDITLNPPIDHIPAILAAYKISETDLQAIWDVARIEDNGIIRAIDPANDKLNIYILSVIYRYTILSKALSLKVAEFCLLIKLFNLDPFSLLKIPALSFTNIATSVTESSCNLLIGIKKTGFKAETLQYIFTGEIPAESKIGLDIDKVKQTVCSIRESLASIEQSHPVIPLTSLTSDLVKSNLLLTFSSDVVNQMIGIIGCRQTFSIITDTGLSVVIPAPLKSKYSYDPVSGIIQSKGIMSDAERLSLKALSGTTPNFQNAIDSLYNLTKTLAADAPTFSIITDLNLPLSISDSLSPKFNYIKASGRLTCTGIMSDSEKVELKSLSGVNTNFRDAVDALYAMPEDFLRRNFSGVFANANAVLPNADFINLLNHPSQPTERTVEEKLQFVYSNYLPLLKKRLREESIIHHISSLTGSSNEVTQLLIGDKYSFFADSISIEGFSSEYFSDKTWSTSVLKRNDPEINFDWGLNSPDPAVPVDDFGVRWQSYIKPVSSGEYTLVVEVKEPDETFNLYLDDNIILKKSSIDSETSWEILVNLNASRLHKLMIEYTETTGNAGIKLSWKKSTSAIEVVPSDLLYPVLIIDDLASTIRQYHRAAKFIDGFKLTESEINHMLKFKTDFGNIDFMSLNSMCWQRINDYVQLRNRVPQSQVLLTDVFSAANITSPAPVIDELIKLVHLATAWDLTVITDFIKNCFGLTINDFKNEIALNKVFKAVSFVLKTGLSSQTILKWAEPETDFDKLHAIAELVKSTVKAKYEPEDWMKLAGDLNDKIRENQKQALISYLLTIQKLIDWGVTDADSLFEYFLIDVQMGACMDTSRIVQANNAVQMFVNRCFLNLESNRDAGGNEHGVAPNYLNKDRWEKWLKYYRVWEVNRKIFITPENWLEPEWRDDKSQFFKELESELMQNDITGKTVETAFRNYLTKLNSVANLDVCGMYQENNPDGTMKLLHVFGRTHNAPYQFFYRTCSSTFKWSAWEKVQLDIRVTEDGDNSGVHLMPVVWKNRMFLFWTEFIEKLEEKKLKKKGKELTLEDISKKAPSSITPKKYYEIRLAWSEYIDNKWGTKQLTKEFIKSPYNSKISDFMLRHLVTVLGNSLVIWMENQIRRFGSYSLNDIQSEIEASTYNGVKALRLKNYENFFVKYKQDGNLDFNGLTYLKNDISHKLLFSTQFFDFEANLKYPFFYQSNNRTYFVRPFETMIFEFFKAPESYFPIIFQLIENKGEVSKNSIPEPDSYFGSSVFTDSVLNSAESFLMDFGVNEGTEVNYTTKAKSYTKQTSDLEQEIIAGEVNAAFSKSKFEGVSHIGVSFVENRKIGGVYLGSFGRWVKGLEFHIFYHPFSSQYVTNLNNFGIDGLMETDTLLNGLQQPFFHDYGNVFSSNYGPNFSQDIVKQAQSLDFYKPDKPYTYYKENICFDVFGANSLYNWELFFHIPLYIATRLSKNGRYEEAM
ncbi:MAG: hypothetical protein GX876_11600, partial [Bacteroidales bacterium]|nr:hypothetical protein [Bacteroidales bacterium]